MSTVYSISFTVSYLVRVVVLPLLYLALVTYLCFALFVLCFTLGFHFYTLSAVSALYIEKAEEDQEHKNMTRKEPPKGMNHRHAENRKSSKKSRVEVEMEPETSRVTDLTQIE